MPGQRQQHQQREAEQQHPVQQGAAGQQRHHDVDEVEDGAEVGPGTDQAQQVALQQSQHRDPREQHDQLLPEVGSLQAVDDRRGSDQQQPGRPGPRQRLQRVLAQLACRHQLAGAAAQPEHQRQQRRAGDAQGRQQALARGIVLAGERGLDLQAAPQPGSGQLEAGAVAFAQRLPQRRRVHVGQAAVLIGDLAGDLGRALLHLRRQGVAATAEVDQLGERSGERRLRPVDLRHQLLGALEQRRRQVGLLCGGLPRDTARGQFGGVVGGGAGGACQVGALLVQQSLLQQPVPLEAFQALHRQHRQVGTLGRSRQPLDGLGPQRQCLLDARRLLAAPPGRTSRRRRRARRCRPARSRRRARRRPRQRRRSAAPPRARRCPGRAAGKARRRADSAGDSLAGHGLALHYAARSGRCAARCALRACAYSPRCCRRRAARAPAGPCAGPCRRNSTRAPAGSDRTRPTAACTAPSAARPRGRSAAARRGRCATSAGR